MLPAPERTDIYDKLGRFLKLPPGKLAGLADVQRKQELKKKIQSPPVPLFGEVRELVLKKCKRDKRREARAIFEREPFGELRFKNNRRPNALYYYRENLREPLHFRRK